MEVISLTPPTNSVKAQSIRQLLQDQPGQIDALKSEITAQLASMEKDGFKLAYGDGSPGELSLVQRDLTALAEMKSPERNNRQLEGSLFIRQPNDQPITSFRVEFHPTLHKRNFLAGGTSFVVCNVEEIALAARACYSHMNAIVTDETVVRFNQ